MSDSESIFTGDSSDQETAEGTRVEEEFLDAMAVHRTTARMDFNKWMREVIIIMLNTRDTEWPVGQLKIAVKAAAKKHGKSHFVCSDSAADICACERPTTWSCQKR
jgi:hypothetical protein